MTTKSHSFLHRFRPRSLYVAAGVPAAARLAGELAQMRSEAGGVNHFEVIDAQRTALAAERAAP